MTTGAACSARTSGSSIDADKALIKLDPPHVLTVTQAAKALHPYINPLSAFDDSLLAT